MTQPRKYRAKNLAKLGDQLVTIVAKLREEATLTEIAKIFGAEIKIAPLSDKQQGRQIES